MTDTAPLQLTNRFGTEERAKSVLLILLCLAQFMVVLDVSVVNVALPSIRDGLGFSVTDLQWVINAFLLPLSALLLVGLLFRLNLDRRASQVGVLFAEGYPRAKVRWLLLGEGGALALVGVALYSRHVPALSRAALRPGRVTA